MPTRRDALAAFGSMSIGGSLFARSRQTPAAARKEHPALLIGERQKLLMIGDSITDAGRGRPVGEGPFGDGVGRGYVMFVEAWLSAVYPERWIRVVNMGISGNTTRDLLARWQTDVLDQKPDWLSIMIGANDVWRQYDSPRQTERHVLIEEYEANLIRLVTQTKPLVKGLVLMTPFYLEPGRQDAMRATMDRYAEVVRRLARAQGVLLVDTQAAFDAVLKVVYPAAINWDRVHPNAAGSAVIARAFLDEVGFDWRR